MAIERTLVVLKPDAVERGLVSEIVLRFNCAGFKLVAWRASIRATQKNLNEHFPSSKQWVTDIGARARTRVKDELHRDPTEYFGVNTDYKTGVKIIKGCHEYYLSGPLCVGVFERDDAVSLARKLIGKTLPSKAEKGTIRGDYGVKENPEQLRGGAARNLVHASDSAEEAQREIAAWFTNEELEATNE